MVKLTYTNTMEPTMTFPSPLPSAISMSMSPNLIWGIFALMVIVAGIVTLVLLYHWTKYGAGVARTVIIGALYLAGTGLLLTTMLVSAAAYTTSL